MDSIEDIPCEDCGKKTLEHRQQGKRIVVFCSTCNEEKNLYDARLAAIRKARDPDE